MRVGIGMLAHSRPFHTALALAYTLCNKAPSTGLHVFYSIYRTSTPPSKATDKMLTGLSEQGVFDLHYLFSHEDQNCGGNVNTLMRTMSSMSKYDYFVKIDDDVLIGPGTDVQLCSMLEESEREHGVLMLMGQAVRTHMRGSNPFSWEAMVQGHRVAQRSNRANPMETMTAVSPRLLNFLAKSGKTTSCDNDKGTYIPYTRNLTTAGAKTAVVLSPPITMQHIGLTSEIERGSPRSWAPATAYESGLTIEVPHFDFNKWEAVHRESLGAVKEFTVRVLARMHKEYADHKDTVHRILEIVDACDPSTDKNALPDRAIVADGLLDTKPLVAPVRVIGDPFARADGRTVRRPRVIKRVRVPQAQVLNNNGIR